jgi:4-amino-4-deoxy-L-arabinose transferase-like glycosyltransferase
MSWLIAMCMWVFGSQAEWVCRLPSAIAGLITAHAIAIITSRLLSHRFAGLLAGLILLTMAWVQIQSRLSEADMPMVATVTVAMLALVPRRDEPQSIHRAATLFWVATGIGFLLKFVAIFITIPAAIMLAIWARDPRVKRILLNPIGLCIFVLMMIGWPLAAYLTYPQIIDTWQAQTIGRVKGEVDAHPAITGVQYIQEFFFHFWTIPWIVLPATPVIIIGLWTAADKYKSWTGKFLLSWVVPFLILITLTAYKSKHYSFSLLPAFAVVGAYGTIVWMRSLKRPQLALPLLATWFIACAAVIVSLKMSVLHRTDSGVIYVDLARRAIAIAPAGERIRLIGPDEHPIAFYLDPIPLHIKNLKDVPTDAPIYAVAAQSDVETLKQMHTVEVLAEYALPESSRIGRSLRKDPLVFVRVN